MDDAIKCQIADGKEGISSGEEINCARPEDEPAAEEGQGIDNGNQNTQQQRMRRMQHQHPDESDDKNKAHQNQLRFKIAQDRSLQFLCFVV